MKKLLCALMILCLTLLPAAAENAAAFRCEYFSLQLIDGLTLMNTDKNAGYEAAVQADFPNASETILTAVSPDAAKAVVVSRMESTASALDAAKEASMTILGSDANVIELMLGANPCAFFACAVAELQFDLYFVSDGANLFIFSASGVERTDMEGMLSGISF